MIEKCLHSVLALDRKNLQILVIDQSTDDVTRRTVDAVSSGDPRVSILSTSTVGTSIARNLAASSATSDVIAYTDDDCTVDAGWLDALMAEFADPQVVAVYGRTVPPGFTTRTGAEVAFKESTGRQVFGGRVSPWHIGHGANMALRLSALVNVGGFDLALGPGGPFSAAEDLDIAYRLGATGGRIVYTGSAVAYHEDGRDWASRRRIERGYGIGAGAAFAKYIRSGDAHGAKLFLRWSWELGVRRLGAGLLKWRSVKPIYLGYCQLVYPWIGAVRSLALPIDRRTRLYVGHSLPLARQAQHPSPGPQTSPSKAVVDGGSDRLVSSGQHRLVQQFFDWQAEYWRDLYNDTDVFSAVIRRREAIALAWVGRLDLASKAPALEVGCGAGGLAVKLAQRGLSVRALDTVPAMVELTRIRSRKAGVDQRLHAGLGDVHSLDIADGTFQLVTALGVLPWLHSPARAIQEMARVLKPGGFMIFSADNWAGLDQLVDPFHNPFLAPVKRAAKHALIRVGARQEAPYARPHTLRRGDVERILRMAQMTRIDSTTCGFGPFSIFKKPIISTRLGVALDRRLQALVDRGVPVLRASGHHYMVLARKG